MPRHCPSCGRIDRAGKGLIHADGCQVAALRPMLPRTVDVIEKLSIPAWVAHDEKFPEGCDDASCHRCDHTDDDGGEI